MVHAERVALVDDLERLDDTQWERLSRCETLDRLRRTARRTSTPPAPLSTRIVEEIVHGEDIRRAATDLDLSIGDGPGVAEWPLNASESP